MQTSHTKRALRASLLLLLAPAIHAADTPAPATFAEALTHGKPSLNARLRYESADQAGLKYSDAETLRLRAGYTTAAFEGFQAMIEGEGVMALADTDNYNAAGTNPGGAGHTVIADPTVAALNQAWLSYSASDVTFKGGRQRIVFDNARFVGDVGWRQNMQTYDAATLTAKPDKTVTVSYGYLWHISRVFGDKVPQRDFKSDSHLINVAWTGSGFGTLTVYGYLLDFENSAANSSNTFGASFAGAKPLSKITKLTYHVEGATQSEAANNPVNYTATYWLGELGVAVAPFDLGVGYEVLGSDGGKKGFATPLATLHAFNGWADVFLNTPAKGLRDTYVSAGVTLPHGFPVKVVYHEFKADVGGARLGDEVDAQIAHKIGKQWTVLAKVAHFNGRAPTGDIDRFWLQAEFNY